SGIVESRRGVGFFPAAAIIALASLGAGWGTALQAAVSFMPATHYVTGDFPVSVAIGDLNGDGKPDLVATSLFNNTVSVLIGNGLGAFGSKTDFATGIHPYSVAIADVNGDGKRDLAVANSYSRTVSILLGNGSGGFAPKTDFAVGINPY